MRKAIFLFIAIILVAVGIDWIDSCAEAKTDTELFGRNLTYADMYEYKDPAYDFVIRYPSFFTAQPNDSGHARFAYSDQWATVVLEGYVMRNIEDRQGEDSFVRSGPQYEDGSRIKGYSYYSKFVRSGKLWFVYTMVYPDRYHDVLTRLFNEIDGWQIWERPHLELKQGESQTPKAIIRFE